MQSGDKQQVASVDRIGHRLLLKHY